MQDLDWPFNPQPGLCHFIQSSPGIREKHSTNLRLIVLIHSTFFREGQRFSGKDKTTVSANEEDKCLMISVTDSKLLKKGTESTS